MQLSIVVPTYNESPNVAELVRRVGLAVQGIDAEMIFVDDSTDDTPDEVRRAALTATLPVRVIHRKDAVGGLGGAVIEGFAAAESDVCVVMDGDLQHPPADIPELYRRYRAGDVDLVVASRYTDDGSAQGLADRSRVMVSRLSTALTRAMFPIRLKAVSDPMTGFFLIDRRAVDLESVKPRGFKILLEILARQSVRVAEIPFRFAERHAGESKASFRQGLHFLRQLTALRFGKMSLFAIIGGLGALANLAIMWGLTHLGVNYLVAAVIGAEVTILANFALQERFVFQDMKGEASGVWSRFAKSFAFNNAEAVIRIPIIALLVNTWHLSSVIAAAITLAVAFVVRFMFHSLVVYAPRTAGKRSLAREVVDELDAQAVSPGEL
ncbi:MAG: glycosyltransferase family 2 protein [Microbacterium sp.]|uniref:glycosyltransferase n=1 Tax=Microbacterium sp. TaxID=51671 RepID=UPI001AC29083|nr:glycosyltransferase family 2 protein [Microbacterium sp.]MBN9155496.1 glycosyltransferase family 2 protein [Microbacterium sp.]MBN9175568.1 glycosyltransferase family 2 protein [Microbacterium sp.]